MDRINFHNFTKTEELEISSSHFDKIGPLVTLKQKAGSCWFSFSTTPAQAREMAAVLIEHANHLEEK